MEATESHHLRDRLYPTLSGGGAARVTMARVLAEQTPVVFLDEPTASLDPRHLASGDAPRAELPETAARCSRCSTT